MQNKKISIVIPTLNEEKNILNCLGSIAKQDYTHSLIEVIIVDARSSDATLDLVKQWKKDHDIEVKLLTNDKIVAEFGKSIGIKSATGNYVCTLDCDEELVQQDLLSVYVKAFDVFPDIIGIDHHFIKIDGGNQFNNFLAVINLPDPLAHQIALFPVEIESRECGGRIIRKKRMTPAYPVMLFLKREFVEPYIGLDTYEEGQVVMDLALRGQNIIAQIDGYGVHHHHVDSFYKYIKKRSKIALKHTTRTAKRKSWVSYTGNRIYWYAFLNLTIIHPLIFAIYKTVKTKEPLWLYWLPTAVLTTWIYAINLVLIKITGKRAW